MEIIILMDWCLIIVFGFILYNAKLYFFQYVKANISKAASMALVINMSIKFLILKSWSSECLFRRER